MNSLCILLIAVACCGADNRSPEVQLHQDDAAGKLAVMVDGREILAYQYGPADALPHYWPLRSPSGKLLTVQHPDPYPHHRSLWIADHVQVEGVPAVDFYHSWKNYQDKQRPELGFRHFIRHQRFSVVKADGHRGLVEAELRWLIDGERPILDERRTMRITALDGGDWFLDLAWELKASYGSVKFVSDQVHYAWPYLRMHPQFSGERGGTIVNDAGKTKQADTDGKVARWIDYSNKVEGATEGIAVMVYPDGETHKWLTREYGTFGPRRPDRFSGTQFTLGSGERLNGRVGILIHSGDAAAGRVAERYRQYSEGRLE